MSTIECEICFLQYNEEALTPRILTNCGHTICQQCAISLLRDERTINCPFDRKDTQLSRNDGVNGLQKNFALLDLCRKEKQEQEQNSGVEADVPCFENPSHEAVVYCQQCEVELCSSCFTSIHKPKAFSAHQKIKVSEKPIKLPKCPEHPNNTAEFLCTDPNCKITTKIMCERCALFDQHKSHKHNFLMEKLLENEQYLKDLLKRNERLLLKKEKCISFLDCKEWEVTGGLYTETVQSISDQFDMMKKEEIHKFTQFANEKKKEQTLLKTRVEDDYSELKKLQDLIQKKLKLKNDLQNRDEITCLENSHRSRISSHDEFVDFIYAMNYDFIVPKTELQITLSIDIKVKSLTGKLIELKIDPRDKIETIKEMMYEKEGIPVAQQRFIFAGEQLLNDMTAADYELVDGSVLHMVFRFGGPCQC